CERGVRVARIRTGVDGRDTELEFFFFPTLAGEAVTIRFQPVSTTTPTLEALDAPESVRRLLVELGGVAPALDQGGLVVVAGPDARARAEVLYALAGAAAMAGRRILTVE